MRKKIFVLTLMIFVMMCSSALASVPLDAAHFPDAALREYLSIFYDTYSYQDEHINIQYRNGILEDIELEKITDIWGGGIEGPVYSLKGIEYLPALKRVGTGRYISASDMGMILSLTNLEELWYEGTELSCLDTSKLVNLEILGCIGTNLNEINVKNNPKLTRLCCRNNNLRELDISNNLALTWLECDNNKILSLNLDNHTNLVSLNCINNCLTELDLRNTGVIMGPRGGQERDGLIVTKTEEGYYKVDLSQYVSKLYNIKPDSIRGFTRNYDTEGNVGGGKSVNLVSYEESTGVVLFEGHVTRIYYEYDTINGNYMGVNIINEDNVFSVNTMENFISDMDENNYLTYWYSWNVLDETSIRNRTADKKGFAADGNSRLIISATTNKHGRVSFTCNDEIGASFESFVSRIKLDKNSSLETVQMYDSGYQVSAVLIAPENFPANKKFPSDKFSVHVKFTADDGKVSEEDMEFTIEAAPVILIPGIFDDAVKTFSVYGKEGVWKSLKDKKFNGEHIFLCDYNASRGTDQINPYAPSIIFENLKIAFDYYAQSGIVCTRADIVAHGLGGLMIRKFLSTDGKTETDVNNWSIRSYKQGMIRRVITVATPHRGTPWADNDITKTLLGLFNNTIWNDAIPEHPVISAMLKPFTLFTDTFLKNDVITETWSRIFGNVMDELKTTTERSYGYPSDVPMYAIYGDVKDDNDFTTFVEGTSILAKSMGKDINFAFYDMKTWLFDYIPKMLQEGNPFGKFLNKLGIIYAVPDCIKLGMNSISVLLFDPDPHDMIVSSVSAAGDFNGHSKGFTKKILTNGGDYHHWSICRQKDVGDEVADLLKGSVDKFKIFGSNYNAAANFTASKTNSMKTFKSATTESEEFNFIDCLKLQVWKSSSSTVKFQVKTNHLTSDDIFCFIDTEEKCRYFVFPVSDGKKFEIEVSSDDIFSGLNIENAEIYCFSRNPMDTDGSSIYMSNIITEIANSESTDEPVKDEIKITTSKLTNGIIKKAYELQLKSSGASPITWTVTGLPKGLSVNETGLINGTPTKSGKFTVNVKAIDRNGAFTSKKFTMTITKPVISGDIKANGVVKKSYSSSLTISGGTKPYTWVKSSGTLPKGLELVPNSTGTKLTLKGTPTTAKIYTFTLKATDKNGATASKKFTVTITKPVISGDIKANGVVKKSYSSSITISGGTKPYTWIKSSGTLPKGLELVQNSTGTKLTLKGTPTTAKEYTFTLKATDKNSATASKKFTVTVTKTTINGALSSTGTLKKSYSSSLTVNGGASPYHWTVSKGTLPTGLKLVTNSTGTKLTLKGTPKTANAYTFTLKATDKNDSSASKQFKITIAKATAKSAQTEKTFNDNKNVNYLQGENYDFVNVEKSFINLKVLSDDILWQGEGKDEDLIGVRANEALNFVIENVPSDMQVVIDDNPIEEIEISDEGSFTLPAEFVSDDFKVRAENSKLKTNEIFISVEN